MKFLKLCIIAFILGVSMLEAKTDTWDKVFPKSEAVEVKKVYFKNRFGITLSADLYMPKTLKKGKNPAIAISGPFGAVKEQVSGLYAQTLAQNGFITLAFDPSFTGESGGDMRNVASTDINTEDFSAAVDFLSTHNLVDANRIGILGVCGFGGFALNAAVADTRIKAVSSVTMYDMTRVNAKGYNDSLDKQGRLALKKSLNAQRIEDFKNNTYAKADGLPQTLSGKEPLFVKEYWEYYKTKRGFHPRSINSNGNWNTTSALTLMNSSLLVYADEIEGAVLVVHGEKAHSRYFGEDAYKQIQSKNKELFIVKDANHVDLYDNTQKIPFDKLQSFYEKYLR